MSTALPSGTPAASRIGSGAAARPVGERPATDGPALDRADVTTVRAPATRPPADGELVPVGVRAAAGWTWRILVIAAGIYGLLRLLSEFKVLVVPVLVALLLVALVRPLTDWGTSHLRLPRGLASILTILFVLGVLAGLGALIGQQVADGFPKLVEDSGSGLGELRKQLENSPLHLTNAQLDAYLTQAQDALTANRDTLVSGALGVASTAADVGSGFFIAAFSIFFFLSSGDRIWGFVVRLFPRTARARVNGAGVRAWSTLTAFVRATVIVAAVDAIGIGVVAAVLGVPLAIPIAVLVFLGAFIPIVGALLTGIVAVLVALVAKGPVVALLMLGGVILVQQVEAHVLQPFLLGRAVSVHPLAVILAIGAGVLMAGIIGGLFAVPLVAVAHVVGEYLVSGEPEQDPDSHPWDPSTRTPEEDAEVASEQAGPLADTTPGAPEQVVAPRG